MKRKGPIKPIRLNPTHKNHRPTSGSHSHPPSSTQLNNKKLPLENYTITILPPPYFLYMHTPLPRFLSHFLSLYFPTQSRVKMLGVFSSSIVAPPDELVAAGCRTPSPKITAEALVNRFTQRYPSAVSVHVGDQVQLAYTHHSESPLQPR